MMRVLLREDLTLAVATTRLYDLIDIGARGFDIQVLDGTPLSSGQTLIIRAEDPIAGLQTLGAVAPSELFGPRTHWISGPLRFPQLRILNTGAFPVRSLLTLYDEPPLLYRGAFCGLLDSQVVAAGATVALPIVQLGAFLRYNLIAQGDQEFNILLTLGDSGFATWNRGAIINVPGAAGGFGGFSSGIPSATSAHPQLNLSIQNLDGANALTIRTNLTILGEA